MDKKLLQRLCLIESNLRDVEWELKHRTGYGYYIPPHVLGKFYAELDALTSIIDWLKPKEANHENY